MTVLAEDAASLSRRIDELLSGAIDEQVREQRAINELMVSVRDGISRLVGDMAALSARVTESRETSQGLREELPFLVQNEVTAATNTLAQRIDVLESAIGELAGAQSQLEGRLSPELIVSGVSEKMETMRAATDETAGTGAADAARNAVGAAAADMQTAFDEAAASLREAIDKQFAQMSRRLADAKTQADELDERIGELAGALAATARLPGDMADTVGRLTSEVEEQTTSVVEQVRDAAADAAAQLQRTVGGIEKAATEMNKRFSEINGRMASFQEQILAYLQVRDVALEEKRDQIVSEILDAYLNTVPNRERPGTIERLRESFRRRRDRKDAGKYRETSASSPRLPQVPREAVDRAVADLVRETGEAAARRPVSPGPAEAPAPVRRAVEREPAAADAAPLVLDESPSAAASDAASFARAKRPAAKPKAVKAPPLRAQSRAKKKSETTSTPAPAEAEPTPSPAASQPGAEDVSTLDINNVDTLDEGSGPLEAEASDDLTSGFLPSGPSDDKDEKAPEAARSKPKPKRAPVPKPAKPARKKTEEPSKAEPSSGDEEWEPVAVEPAPAIVDIPVEEAPPEPVSPASAPAAPGGSQGDDTLAQALARVEALVAQHRDPAAKRKPPTRKPKKAE